MSRDQIITELQQFFTIDELVCPHTLKRWGDKSWQFLDTAYLHSLLVIRRDILKAPMYCNGPKYTQRGLRCNLCQLVKEKAVPYLSAHILGKAGDFDVTGMTAARARAEILANSAKLPYPIRLEDGVNWLHLDTQNFDRLQKVYFFKA